MNNVLSLAGGVDGNHLIRQPPDAIQNSHPYFSVSIDGALATLGVNDGGRIGDYATIDRGVKAR